MREAVLSWRNGQVDQGADEDIHAGLTQLSQAKERQTPIKLVTREVNSRTELGDLYSEPFESLRIRSRKKELCPLYWKRRIGW